VISKHILFEDNHLVVLDKPAGLLSQSDAGGEQSLVDLLRVHFGRHYVGLIHRLDRNTSGLMVIAKRSKAAERLTSQLQDGRLERRYLAWLEGHWGAPGSMLNLKNWLIKNEATNVVRALAHSPSKPHPDAKQAELVMQVLKHVSLGGQPVTEAEFTLQTGRSHQIRAQSAFAGHPLVGDKKYGARMEWTRTALHSHYLSFEHPMTHERVEWKIGAPEDLGLSERA